MAVLAGLFQHILPSCAGPAGLPVCIASGPVLCRPSRKAPKWALSYVPCFSNRILPMSCLWRRCPSCWHGLLRARHWNTCMQGCSSCFRVYLGSGAGFFFNRCPTCGSHVDLLHKTHSRVRRSSCRNVRLFRLLRLGLLRLLVDSISTMSRHLLLLLLLPRQNVVLTTIPGVVVSLGGLTLSRQPGLPLLLCPLVEMVHQPFPLLVVHCRHDKGKGGRLSP